MSKTNRILSTDSYKCSQYAQYPVGTEYVYSYIESRGGAWDKTVYFGLQAFIKEYLLEPITKEEIDEAEEIILAHGEPFNRAGWDYILEKHNGFLPLKIRSAKEGSLIPVKNVLATIENTDPNCAWLTSYMETALLRGIWYPTTVATNSYESKKIIMKYLEMNGTPALIDFKLHDFGARGVSSSESAGIGGMAHLINFMGTDTIEALVAARKYYGAKMAGFSIPAMEHSTVTSWGRDKEVDSYRNMLMTFGKPGALLACVSDSYDIYEACRKWGTELKDEVIASGATVVIRPDSGHPPDVVLKCLQILDQYYGSVVNDKGFKVLNHVRVIQGDGIDHSMINAILAVMHMAGYSADNVAFGQGGALLQQVNRDTMKFAMKCSAIRVNGEWRDVFKDPVTDHGKVSKKGRVVLFQNSDGSYYSGREDWMADCMQIVFLNGYLFNEIAFDEVRANARK